jgi:hypothetical protein
LAESHHVVVDGSNLATEGRTSPSLAQLDEAVRSYAAEDPDSSIIVVVDATFEHRVSESEREKVREAMLDGDMVSPPAGAIGRGDAFVLRIAERTKATVLSNDSFQEFHGEHPWLFDNGRLVGGKPVPGVGWIFTPRLPIRGPKSRAATAEAKSKKDPDSAPVKAAELARAAKKAAKRTKSAKKAPKTSVPLATTWPLVPATPPPVQPKVDPVFVSAVDEAVEEALHPPGPKATRTADAKAANSKGGKAKKDEGSKPSAGTAPTARGGSKKKKRGTSPPPAVNEPLAFINFVAAFSVDSTIEGEVVSFTSHGAMVDVGLPGGGVLHCYIPLTAMGTPPPTKARQVLKKGEVRPFLLAGLDPPRRVAELALPSIAVPAPSDASSGRQRSSAKKSGPAPTRKSAAEKKAAAKRAAASAEKPSASASASASAHKATASAGKTTAAKPAAASTKKPSSGAKAAASKSAASMRTPRAKEAKEAITDAGAGSSTKRSAGDAIADDKKTITKKAAKASPSAKKAASRSAKTASPIPAKKAGVAARKTSAGATKAQPAKSSKAATKNPAKKAGVAAKKTSDGTKRAAKRSANPAKKAAAAKKVPPSVARP